MTTRPTKSEIRDEEGKLVANWREVIESNDIRLVNGPLPIHEHVGDETDLQQTFPAGAYGNCLVWVNHSTAGWTLYHTDGNGAWSSFSERKAFVSTAGDRSQVGADQFVRFTAPGDYDFLPAAQWPGKSVTIRNDTGGSVTLTPHGSETINGNSSFLLANGKTVNIHNDGSILLAAVSS